MRKRNLLVLTLVLIGCSADVSDLDDLAIDPEACDRSGTTVLGTDLDLKFIGVFPHVNQDMFFAVTVGEERDIEAMMVLSTLDDPDLHLVVPKLLPEGDSELAFWADSPPMGFNGLEESDNPPDHQWKRAICPDGKVTFEHTTPFQNVREARSTGAIFRFVLPDELVEASELFEKYRMWVSATLLDDNDNSIEKQTRAFYRWSPHVDPADGTIPRSTPTAFQVGGNALDEPRGPIDTRSLYKIEFVIDVDEDDKSSAGDFTCTYDREMAPDDATWEFEPNLENCDAPNDFVLADFIPDAPDAPDAGE